MARSVRTACIYVLAGMNGAGKSSISGEMFRKTGSDYYNPDETAARILAANPAITREEANGVAWLEGKRLLERAITERLNFAFETTLGGRTIVSMLERALSTGIEVRVWYVGLRSPGLCLSRIRARVRSGGHDIPEAKVRERYDSSRVNLIRLLPKLTELRVFDNSEDADPSAGIPPKPELLLHFTRGKITDICDLARVPVWAKPILMAALKTSLENSGWRYGRG